MTDDHRLTTLTTSQLRDLAQEARTPPAPRLTADDATQLDDAADLIDALRAENDRLRRLLEDDHTLGLTIQLAEACDEIARLQARVRELLPHAAPAPAPALRDADGDTWYQSATGADHWCLRIETDGAPCHETGFDSCGDTCGDHHPHGRTLAYLQQHFAPLTEVTA